MACWALGDCEEGEGDHGSVWINGVTMKLRWWKLEREWKSGGKRQKRAVEEDGSSYVNVESFIEELRYFLQREILETAGDQIKNDLLVV